MPAGEARKTMEEYNMDSYSMEELRQIAEDIVPLLQEMFGEGVGINVLEDLQVNMATVVICLQLPGAAVLPSVDVRDLLDLDTVEEMADAAAAMIQNALRNGLDLSAGGFPPVTPQRVLRSVQLEVVNQEKNTLMLKRCPHVAGQDLAGVFVVPMKQDASCEAMCLLRQDVMESMGFTVEQLYAAAKKNMLRRFRVRVIRVDRMSDQMLRFGHAYGNSLESADMGEDTWYFVDNWRHMSGSAYILFPEVLERLGDKMEKNYYIAVPNRNMMLVYPDSGNSREPREMVAWLLQQEELFRSLSEHLYYYDRRWGLQSLKDA